MISLLLAADAVAKLGAAIGGSIAELVQVLVLEKLVVKQWMQWQDGEILDDLVIMIIAAALVEGVAFFAVTYCIVGTFHCKF